MQTQPANELNNIYGYWHVESYAGRGARSPGSVWTCRCQICNDRRAIRGTDLRRMRLPLCANHCRKCNRSRDQVQFKGNKRICVECERQRMMGWRSANKDHRSKYMANWRQNGRVLEHSTRPKVTEHIANKQFEYNIDPHLYLKNMLRRKIELAKLRSRPPHKTIQITPDYLVKTWDLQNGKCAITGTKMLCQAGLLETVSIDRIESNKGYVEGNIQLVCKWVNLAKNRFSNDDMKNVLDRFAHHRFQPFLITAPEIMALAGPIIQWLREDDRNPLVIAGTDKVMVGYRHDYGGGKQVCNTTNIHIHFYNDRIDIKTDADCVSDDAFAILTDFADPSLFDKVIDSVKAIQNLGSRGAVFEARDARVAGT
jgi:hypothetical protein